MGLLAWITCWRTDTLGGGETIHGRWGRDESTSGVDGTLGGTALGFGSRGEGDDLYGFHVFSQLHEGMGTIVEAEGMEAGFRRAAAEPGLDQAAGGDLEAPVAVAACAGAPDGI